MPAYPKQNGMRKNPHIFVPLIITPILLFLLRHLLSHGLQCEAMAAIADANLLTSLPRIVMRPFLIATAGILLFFILRGFVGGFADKRLQAAYIIGIWGMVLYPGLRSAIQERRDIPILQSLCAKTTGNPMVMHTVNATYPEYQYLQRQLHLLPAIPKHADAIQIIYYHDGFLPDYSLTVEIRLPRTESINTHHSLWHEIRRDERFTSWRYDDHEG